MAQTKQIKKILLAFSGGLDTSTLVPWLKEKYNAEIVCYCSDLGNAPDAEWLKKWALELGASDLIFEDVKEEFASRFVFPAVRANATYQDTYLLGTSLGRPLIAERMAYFAKKLGADAVSHGCTGKGNDQLRLERSWAFLIPEVEVIAPWRIWDFKGRGDLIEYMNKKGFKMSAKEKIFSEDVNLMHRSCEGGVLENPEQEYAPEEVYNWVKTPANASKDCFTVDVGFEKGLPVSLNGKKLSAAALLTQLNEVGGMAGVGVLDLVEERANGIKSRGVYETPGGTVLHAAIQSLKHLNWDRSMLTTARALGVQYGELVYDGFWHSDLHGAMEAFFTKASESLTGNIVLKLQSGAIRVASRKSAFSLYDTESVSFEGDTQGIHKLADGYCKIAAVRQKQLGKRAQKMHNAK